MRNLSKLVCVILLLSPLVKAAQPLAARNRTLEEAMIKGISKDIKGPIPSQDVFRNEILPFLELPNILEKLNFASLKRVINDKCLGYAFSHEGTRFIVVHRDLSIKVFDTQTGQEIYAVSSSETPYYKYKHQRAKISNDGTKVALFDRMESRRVETYRAQVWDLVNQRKIIDVNMFEENFSPDGIRIAMADAETGLNISIFDTVTGEKVTQLQDEISRGVLGDRNFIFSPDNKKIMVHVQTEGGRFNRYSNILFDALTGKRLLQLEGDNIRSVFFSPDGTNIITINNDNTLRALNAEDYSEIRSIPNVGFAKYNYNGTKIALLRSNNIEVWDAMFNNALYSIDAHIKGKFNQVSKISFSDNGSRILIESKKGMQDFWNQSNERRIVVVNSGNGQVIFKLNGASYAALSPDGTKIAEGAFGEAVVTIRDLATRTIISNNDCYGNDPIFNPNPRLSQILTGNLELVLWSPGVVWSIKSLSVEQKILIYFLEHYYPELQQLTKIGKISVVDKNKILQFIARLKNIDYQYIKAVFQSFSPEQQHILRKVYKIA